MVSLFYASIYYLPLLDSLFCFSTGYREQMVGLRAALDGARFIAVRSVTYPLLTDQGTETGTRLVCAVNREGVGLQWGASPHPATGSLQPVAIGATVEETKPSKPSRKMCRYRRCSEPTGRNSQ
jgi:hypothetical protein